MPTVLFVCEGNRFRSQMAEAFFNANAPPGWRAVSAGTKPRQAVAPAAIELMAEVGIDLSHHVPKPIDEEVASAASRIITMCSPSACPVRIAERAEHWGLPDPSELPPERWRELRDRIEENVRALIREIAAGAVAEDAAGRP